MKEKPPHSDNPSADTALHEQISAFMRSLSHLKRQLQDSSQIGTSRTSPQAQHQPKADISLSQALLALQNQFQAIVSSASQADIDPKAEQSLMSYQTEAHRRLRLLQVEAMRLQTARQPETIERVRSQIGEHLNQVQQFAQAMMREVA